MTTQSHSVPSRGTERLNTTDWIGLAVWLALIFIGLAAEMVR